MDTDDLFQKVLLEPILQGANQLFVVSGFATAAMAFHHIGRARELEQKLDIKLIVGMTSQLGISRANHEAFQILMEDSKNRFECSYLTTGPAVHSKVYAWATNEKPSLGWCGSANYTQTAFSGRQREAMQECDPANAKAYFEGLVSESLFCTHLDAEQYVYETPEYLRTLQSQTREEDREIRQDLLGLETVTISLLDNKGRVPERSGLNWGQRPEERREPNQAYIHVPAGVYRTDFFPPVGTHFTILTDDDKVLVCTRAQQNGKAIHTPHNNSLLGEYFRNRLELANGALVTLEDFANYGRDDLRFYKIDEETFFMDFSAPNG